MSNDLLLSSRLDELSQCKEIETFCVKLVYEFLVCNNFNKTIVTFVEEIQTSEFSLPEELPLKKERIEKDDVLKIVSAMEMEDHLQFFEKWTELVPNSIKDVPDYKNITLPLYTYFATLPVRKEKSQKGEDSHSVDNSSKSEIDKIQTETLENGVTNDTENNNNELSQLSTDLNSTYTILKPIVQENAIEVGYISERDPDMEPDSLESEVEISDTEGKRKRRKNFPLKFVGRVEDEDTVVVYDKDIEEEAKKKEDVMTSADAKEEKKKEEDRKEVEDGKEVEDKKEVEDMKEIEDKKETEEGGDVKVVKEVEEEEVPTAMSMFQEFLLEKKYSFNTEPQYLPLFALPFIQNPEEHEAFNQLFQDKWVRDLRDSLFSFLIKFSCGDDVVPEIVKLCKENKLYASQMKKKSDLSDDYSKLYKESRRKLHKLKRDHKNLVGVASELATALENSVRGEAVDIKSTLYKCITIFPELFPNAHISESQFLNHVNSTGTCCSIFIDGHSLECIKIIQGDANEKTQKDKMWPGLSHLDTKKIKEDLMNGSIKTKLLLMQALRWGLCEADVEERERLVSWVGREDVLGLAGEGGEGRRWLDCGGEAHPLQQAAARLVNCLASLRSGRDYVSSAEPPLVPLLASSLVRAQERLTQDMLLALLQKLSLRKGMCEEMIKQGLLEWLSSRLGQSRSLYQLEYSTSLFMNLCIHAPVGYWDTRPHQVLPPLLKLITTPLPQVLEFVLGSLYCLLRSDKLNIFARSVGLSGELSAVSCERCQRQAAELLKLHRRELSPATVRLPPPTLNEEDIEDPEEMETEVNAEDPVKGSPSGNVLLTQQYSLIFPAPGMLGRGSEDRMRLRPSTPRALQNLPAWAI